jgi:hypothetical protein
VHGWAGLAPQFERLVRRVRARNDRVSILAALAICRAPADLVCLPILVFENTDWSRFYGGNRIELSTQGFSVLAGGRNGSKRNGKNLVFVTILSARRAINQG